MYCFDTMSKVCIVLFQIMQKFDDVVFFFFWPYLKENMDLH